jgi:hypothetical protein
MTGSAQKQLRTPGTVRTTTSMDFLAEQRRRARGAACTWRIGDGEDTGNRRRAAAGEGPEGGGCGGGGQVNSFARKGDIFS